MSNYSFYITQILKGFSKYEVNLVNGIGYTDIHFGDFTSPNDYINYTLYGNYLYVEGANDEAIFAFKNETTIDNVKILVKEDFLKRLIYFSYDKYEFNVYKAVDYVNKRIIELPFIFKDNISKIEQYKKYLDGLIIQLNDCFSLEEWKDIVNINTWLKYQNGTLESWYEAPKDYDMNLIKYYLGFMLAADRLKSGSRQKLVV